MLQDDEILKGLLEQLQTPQKAECKECPLVTIRHFHSLSNPKDDTESCVFPPVNHENLQILSHNSKQHEHSSSKLPALSLSPCDVSSEKAVNGWLHYGFKVLRTKIYSMVSLFESKDGARKGAFCTSGRFAGLAIVVIWWWFCRRRRNQRERVDNLKLIIKEKDEVSVNWFIIIIKSFML